MKHFGSDRRDLVVVAVPALLTAALCLYELTTRSLWLDEAASVAIASQHGAALGNALAHDGGNMLGYYALLHVLIGLFGNGALVIRLPSVVAAVATVAIVCVLALRLFNQRVAGAAGLLAAVSLPLVFWGQDARGYTPMVALVAASYLALLVLLDGGGWRAWLAYAVLTTAAVYSGLEAVLVVPAQLVALYWYRDRIRPVLSAVAVSALCCVPLAVLAASRGSGQLFWVPRPDLLTIKQVVQALTSSGLQPNFYTSSAGGLAIVTGLVLVTAAFNAWRLFGTAPGRTASGPLLIVAWLLVPALLALIESAVGQSIFQARYLLLSLPAVALLLAWTIVDERVPRLLALAGLAALIALRAVQLAPSYGRSPENWRAATSYVLSGAHAGDCTAFYPLDTRMPFKYYLGSGTDAPRSILPAVPWSLVRSYVEDYVSPSPGQLTRLRATCTRVWLISSHEGRVGGPPVSSTNYTRFRGLVAALGRDYPRSQSASFGYPGAVAVALFSR